jgi:hypothetical protein
VIAGAVTGANGTIKYSWKNASGSEVGTTATVNNLAAGTYTLTVSDDCGTQTNTVTIGSTASTLALAASSKTDAGCGATGSVIAGAVTGANGTIKYSWKNASGSEVGTTATVNNLAAGTYTLTVSDDCGTQTNTVTIGSTASTLALAASSKTDAGCGATGSVIAGAVTGANGTIKYSWKNASGSEVGTTATVNNLAAGTYTLTVSDDCGTQTNTVTIGSTASTLALAASSKTDAGCGATGSVIAGAVTGANGTIKYSWKNASGSEVGTTATVNNLAAGTYTLTVSDDCGTQTNTVTIGSTASTLALAASSKTDAGCGATGSVIAGAVTGANGTIKYSWKNASGSEVGTTATVNNLAAGTYTLTVSDDCGTQTNTVTIGSTASTLALAASSKTDAGCGATGSVIAGAVTGANGTIKYSWKNASGSEVGTTATVNNLAAGTYTLTVSDDCGTQTNTVTIGSTASTLALAASSKTDAGCGATGSVIAGAVTGANGTIKYSWKNASGSEVGTTATVNNLAAGTYTLTVSDDCGTQTNTVTIGSTASTLALAASSKTDAGCGATGSVIAGAVTGANGTIKYSWKNASGSEVGTTATVNNLAAGTYTLTVSDDCGTQTNTVTIGSTASTLALAASSKTDAGCGATGSVIAGAVTGANGTIKYSWKNASGSEVGTTATVNNLAAGTYTLTVSDDCGTQTNTVTIGSTASTLALAASSKTDAGCGATGSVIAGAVTGANGTIKYSWKNASGSEVGTTATVNNLAAGTYTLTVSDDCGTQTNTVTIGSTASTLALAASSKTDAGCGATGSVIAGAVTGANGTIKYSWKNASGSEVGTTATVNNLAAGTYTLTVSDDCGTQTNTVTIGSTASTLALAASSKTDAGCGATGSVIAGAVTGANGTIKYSWKNASGSEVGTTATVNNLAAGTYTLTVSDDCGTQTNTVTIGSTASTLALAASSKTDAGCGATGSVIAGAVTGANGTIKYSWKNASGSEVGTTATVNNLAAGTYTLTVSDDCGTQTNTVTIGSTASTLALAASSKTDAGCGATGSVIAGAVTGANGTIKYSWKNASGSEVGTTATVNNLAAGTYTLTVSDDCGTQTNTVTIGSTASTLALAASSKTDAGCGATGSVIAGAVTGANGTIKYSWKNASGSEVGTTATVNNLAAGTYTLTVSDDCGTQTNTVTIGSTASTLALAASSKTDAGCGATGSVIAGAVTGANGTIKYSWKNASGSEVGTTATVNNLAAGTYTLTVSDDCGTQTNTVTIGSTASTLALAASSKTDAGCGATGSVIAGAVTGANGTIKYSWKNASGSEVGTTATVNNLAAGTYTLTVSDDCGTQTNTVTIGSTASTLALAASSKTDAGCGATGSVIAGAVTGANGTIKYSWKNASGSEVGTTATVNNLAAGTYTLTVSDDCGTQTNTVTIGSTASTLALAASSKTDAGCGATGSVIAGAVTGANGTIKYSWKNASGSEVGTTATVNNLAAGTYTLTVSDDCGTQTNTVTIGSTASTLALAASSKTDAGCGATGSVIAGAVTGANGTIKYSWKNASGSEVGTTATVNNLAAGTYTLTVSDDCGTQTNTVTIGSTASTLALAASSKTDAGCGATGSVIAGAVTGANGTIKYSWKNASGSEVGTTATVNNLAAGTYTLTVSDDCGTQTNTVTIGSTASTLALAASSKTDAGCGATGSVIAGAVTGANGTIKYSWKNASGSEVGTTATVNNLAAGTYTLTVSDDCGTQTNTVTIGSTASTLALAASSKTDAGCGATGSVIAGAVTGANGTIKYSWKNASGSEVGTTATVNNLAAGTYTLTVSDDCGTQTNTVTIGSTASTLALAASSKTDAGCGATGSVIAGAVTGANGTIKYSWKNASGSEVGTTATVNNLAAGTYTLTVSDDCGTQTNTVTIGSTASTLALAASSKTDAGCGATGSVIAGAVTGANGTIKYSWKNASGSEVGTTATVNNLAAGTYTLTVSDDCGTQTNTVTIGSTASTLALAASSKTDAGCGATGSVIAGAVTGANGTIKYSWKNASGSEVGTTATVNNLAAGTYTLTVSDDCGTQTNTVTIGSTASTLALAASSKTDAGCGATGSVIAGAVTGANGTIKYSWKNASGSEVGTTATVNNLAAGTYTLTVSDDCGTQTNTVTIGSTASTLALAASSKTDAGCGATGSVIAGAVTGANGTIKYSWKNASGSEVGTTATVNNLAAGTYTLTVSDDCGTQTNTVTIGSTASTLALAASSKTDAGCGATGSVIAGAVTGANGTIKYSWKNASGSEVGTTATVNNLAAGTYTLTVSDDCGTQTNTVTITAAVAPTAILSAVDPTCVVPTGTIKVTSATTGLEFAVDGGAYASYPAGGFSGLASGAHTIKVKNAAGCETALNINLGDTTKYSFGSSCECDRCNMYCSHRYS